MNDDDLTIAQIAAGNPDFSILVTALEAADLVGAVADADADLTVFAPTNAAFATLAADLGYAGDPEDADAVFGFIADALAGLDPEGDPIPLLTSILLFHVSPGAQTAAAIEAAGSVATLEGTAIAPSGGRLVDQEPDLLDPEIVAPDVTASNGTIQVIDRVLLPLDIPGNDAPSIVDIATGNDNFEVLVLALQAAGLVETLADPDAEFTVFAPTDDAFAALATDLGFAGDTSDPQAVFDAIAGVLAGLAPDSDPIPLLTDILLYHVSAGAQSTDELIAAPQVATLEGSVVIPTEGGILDADPEVPNAGFVEGLTNLAASNGTVQVIDRVLLPLDLDNAAEGGDTIAGIVAASGDGFDGDTGDFDVLLAALQAAGLVGALDNAEDSFTVFAPTDAAFIELARTFGADPADEEEAFNAIVGVLTALDPEGDPIPLLTETLLYHVIQGQFTRVSLAEGPALTSLATDGIAPATDGESLADEDTDVADPQFLDAASDIVAANGLVQAIDRVLLPLDVPEAVGSGGDGDDVITVNDATVAVMGGAGEDTAVFSQVFADATFEEIAGGFTVTVGDQSVDLMGVETIQFTDETVVVDDSEEAAQAARLFEAGFGREGQPEGVAFLADMIREMGLDAAASAVTMSEEFEDQFGPNPEHSDYVTALFENVLERPPLQEGLEFWSNVLATPGFDVPDLLLFFSESPEYRDLVENVFDDGVLLLA